jgi:hypothetical protein
MINITSSSSSKHFNTVMTLINYCYNYISNLYLVNCLVIATVVSLAKGGLDF